MIKQTQFPFADKKNGSLIATIFIAGAGVLITCVAIKFIADKKTYELKNENQ